MSQNKQKEKRPGSPRKTSPPGQSSPRNPQSPAPENRPQYQRPSYMTVGSGSTSENALRLTEMLDDDSGYGSLVDGSSNRTWSPDVTDDYAMGSPLRLAEHSATENERRAMASHIHQLHYNQNRTALSRAITRTMDTMRRLQEENREWPVQYPSMQPPSASLPHPDPRPGIHHTQSTMDNADRLRSRPGGIRRSDSSTGDNTAAQGESSSSAAQRSTPEPRLVTPQLARDFSVLKIDLKMDGLPQTEIIHSLRKDSKALAQLLDGQINKSIRHFQALRERIEDTSSKVLVTGDLNAGKSTFCNALLRRKILPEDEQPCTSIFCEVLDVRDNAGVEEVHAIPVGVNYDRNDESTYHVYPLQKLEQVVVDSDHYSQCKIYVKDIRTVDESLLNNGVLDIALIDAPGLNNDSLKTTAVFARQEEIDVVVFVVSAANHFTLSAREFIYDAAREKAFIFMVVNGFDNIRNQQRCQEQILKQVAHLSPATFKESKELVHFVSSNAIPVSSVDDTNSGPGGGSSSGPGFDDPGNDPDGDGDDDSPNKGKGKEKKKLQDFSYLEASLRRFVLEKRARSKLAPARTYLMNVLDDLNSLATYNRDVAQSELERVQKELEELEPVLEQSKKSQNEAGDEVDKTTEGTAADVYSYTRETLNATISNVSRRNLGVEYPGFWYAFQFADDITSAMLQEISNTVGECEDYARGKTGEGVNMIKSLGLLHLGDSYTVLNFQPDRMLRRKKDALARQVDIDIEVWDFFDVVNLWERQEKVAGTGMAVTVAGVLGTRMIGGVGWVDGALGAARVMGTDNLRRLLIPGLILTAVLGLSYAVASIPQSLPRRLAQKLAAQLATLDYTHANAQRISSEVRRALKLPADELRVGLQRNAEELGRRREETAKVAAESEVARKYFGNLVRESGEIRSTVERVDLEGPPAGIAGSYDF